MAHTISERKRRARLQELAPDRATVRVSYWCAALLLSVASAAAEWRVDSTSIAWAEAAEPANGVSAKLQVECLEYGRIASLVISEDLMAEDRIGVSFRFDRGPIEHRISPLGNNLRTVRLMNVSSDRLARGNRFRIVLHPVGSEPLFYEFDLTGSAAAISAVRCRRPPHS